MNLSGAAMAMSAQQPGHRDCGTRGTGDPYDSPETHRNLRLVLPTSTWVGRSDVTDPAPAAHLSNHRFLVPRSPAAWVWRSGCGGVRSLDAG
jgi:hypothetical protein